MSNLVESVKNCDSKFRTECSREMRDVRFLAVCPAKSMLTSKTVVRHDGLHNNLLCLNNFQQENLSSG